MREIIRKDAIDYTFDELKYKMEKVLSKKGFGSFSSTHEILGVTTEEYCEVVDAVHRKDYDNLKEELLDLAIACVFGVSCIEQKSLDW